MNDNSPPAITDQRLLAAMMAVNPPLEKLMAERLSLRHETLETRRLLTLEQRRTQEFSRVRDVLIPSYIGVAKAATIFASALALIALGTALFTDLLETKLPASLFASLLLPLWLVDTAERRFGRWEMNFSQGRPFGFRSAAN